MKKKAVVLISGGMDSLVTLAIASKDYEIYALHADYRHRTEKKEHQAFEKICNYYKVKQKLIIDLSFFGKIKGSALTDKKIKIPTNFSKSSNIPVTYVPFRNTILISIAVAWAESIEAEKIFIGAVEEDSSGYPDCREIYYKIFNELIKEGSRAGEKIKIITPLIHMTKAEIVKKGVELKVPFHLSWSCYSSSSKACGICDSCRLRLKGFYEAGIKDPLPYKKR